MAYFDESLEEVKRFSNISKQQGDNMQVCLGQIH